MPEITQEQLELIIDKLYFATDGAVRDCDDQSDELLDLIGQLERIRDSENVLGVALQRADEVD